MLLLHLPPPILSLLPTLVFLPKETSLKASELVPSIRTLLIVHTSLTVVTVQLSRSLSDGTVPGRTVTEAVRSDGTVITGEINSLTVTMVLGDDETKSSYKVPSTPSNATSNVLCLLSENCRRKL